MGESHDRPCADHTAKDSYATIVDELKRSERSLGARIARARYTAWLSRQRA
jgi:hypothetical protein